MSKIGDLWFALRGDPKQLNVDVKKAGDTAGDSFGKRMAAGFKKSWSGQNIGKGLVQGLGLAGGLGAVGLATMAISKITDVLGDATTAALEEEVSVQQLGTALRANIPNWDGQTAAIEDVLKARMKLGFSDDDQRASLATLASATHDVTKSLELERGAMDISRARKVDLATASDAVAKAYAGNTKGLKSMLPGLKLGATATETLANAFAMVNGQAEDYADTNAGKLLVSQVKVGEALEKLGAVTMPLVTDATVALADAASNLADAWDVATGKAKAGSPEIEQLAFAISLATKGIELETLPFRTLIGLWQTFFGVVDNVLHVLTPWNEEADKAREALNHFADDSVDSIESLKSHAVADLKGVRKTMAEVAAESGLMADGILDDNEVVKVSWQDLRDALKKDAESMVDDVFDPIITADRLRANEAELAAQRAILASKSATAAEKRDARDKIHQLEKDNAEYLISLAEAGATNTKAYGDGITELKNQIKHAKGPAKAALQAILDKILEIERHSDINIKVRVSSKTTSGLGPGGKAAGGPQQANTPYWVGERGPEIHVPSTSGRILTASQSIAAVSGGGGTMNETNIVQVQGLLPVRTMADIRRERTHLQDARRLRNGLGRR